MVYRSHRPFPKKIQKMPSPFVSVCLRNRELEWLREKAGKLIVLAKRSPTIKSKSRPTFSVLARLDVLLWNCRHVRVGGRSKTHQATSPCLRVKSLRRLGNSLLDRV